MTTVLSQKGQVVLPASVRKELDLSPGDDFEILLEDDGSILLRPINSKPNMGLVDHLLNAPGELTIPVRPRDFPSPPKIG